MYVTENVGEIAAIQHLLQSRLDVRPGLGNWRWNEDNPFPPVKAVLNTRFWRDDIYADLRAHLNKVPPKLHVLELGGEFVSGQLVGSGQPEPKEADPLGEDIPEEGVRPVTQVPLPHCCSNRLFLSGDLETLI